MTTHSIHNRYTGAVIYSGEHDSMRDSVEAAIKSDAILTGAILTGANLRDANLRDANLNGAILTDANLTSAILNGAILTDANLRDANLARANLAYADLNGANLTGANLRDANLSDANLTGAILTDANLRDANLTGADLTHATMPDGRKWEEYQTDHMAGICTTPGVREKAYEAWGNHTWNDCPMHCALGIDEIDAISDGDLKLRVACWVAMYDAKLLSKQDAIRNGLINYEEKDD